MSQPPPYSRKANFTNAAADNPLQLVSPASLDLEFNAILTTVVALLANIAKIQRDDGALRNASVSIDTLRPDVLLVLGASSQWRLRGSWEPDAAYLVSDVIVDGLRTLVATMDHTAAADIEEDIAAGRWVLLFDAGGTVPADGSVTTAKLADASVTAQKLNLTDLDLTGSVRAQTGFAAGTAPAGSLFHARRDAGDAYLHVERKTADQGRVGVRITGVTGGDGWFLDQAAGEAALALRHSVGGTVLRARAEGFAEAPGGVLVTGAATPPDGAGLFNRFAANVAYSDAYDFTAAVWKDYQLRGKIVSVVAGGVSVVQASSAGINVAGVLSLNGKDIRDLPQVVRAAASQLELADRGKAIVLTSGTAVDMTIPANVTVALPVETLIVLINDGVGVQTIKPAAGVTLVQAGTGATGNRTLGSRGMATLYQVSANRWFISGPGVA